MTEGPHLRLSVECSNCNHVSSERYTCQGDSGREYYCNQPGVKFDNKGQPRAIGSSAQTPKWCPWYPSNLQKQIDRLNRGI